ncbi:MAG TPA: bifunctional [glutamate--ammonia ligase]-adenylyl-L-tyrosine phosphorylase/[glutamate--ammonia-ligase] adenylyltransferase, partial [Gammaproteobacteria bacterium]|nr:bifunctional [glutamate--ammonia ligase]-adenylyl-L-tyrosine phosphorylase/[glutamate--ammonia-ligase] adenylyltransferase [Gammaproteobacteria bacterium]
MTRALPPELQAQWQRVAERLGHGIEIAGTNETIAAQLPMVAACSDFVVSVLERQPERLLARIAEGVPPAAPYLDAQLDLDACANEAEALATLRRVRRVETARIAWLDLTGAAMLEQSLADLSLLADCAIRAAATYAAKTLEPRYGRVQHTDGRPLPLLILAMGKLGGHELNFSSDIDLVLLYPDGGRMSRGELEVEEYFRRLTQLIIRLLDQTTDDGFAYRVDTRLRPFGASGPLAVSLSAFETYLVRHGRDWERYAYVKARLVTGAESEAELFGEVLTPFIYRRYLDYGVFESLRQMKALISKEVARRDMVDNIKLGPGGIREIEFIVQTLQLVRGGRDARLRGRALLEVLPRLAAAGQLDAALAGNLGTAYRFLRRLENLTQAIADQQTHDLPVDELDRARVALAMGATGWGELAELIAAHRGTVERAFRATALDAKRGAAATGDVASWATAWETGEFADVLAEYDLGDDAELAATLATLSQSSLYRRMDEPSRQRLGAVIARIAVALATLDRPAELLKRVLPVLQAIGRRSAYLSLLIENPAALERLLTLARHSEFLVRQIATHPMLLDELLDPRVLETPPSRAELEELLDQTMRGAAPGDSEMRLDLLQQFQRTAVFRIAIADRFGRLPLMKVSDRLTDTAELVLDFSLAMAHAELREKYGRPMCGPPQARREAEFIIVAYGKLGGLE